MAHRVCKTQSAEALRLGLTPRSETFKLKSPGGLGVLAILLAAALSHTAPAARVDCLTWACIGLYGGLHPQRRPDSLGLTIVLLRGTHFDTEVISGPGGAVLEIRSYRLPKRLLASRDILIDGERTREDFDDAGKLVQRVVLRQEPADDRLHLEEREHLRYGRSLYHKTVAVPAFGPRNGVEACLSGLTPIAVRSDLEDVLSEVLQPGAATDDRVRIQQVGTGCGSDSERWLKESLTEGLRCLNERTGPEGQRNAQLLFALLSDRTRPIQIACYPNGFPARAQSVLGINDSFLGLAVTCPESDHSGSRSVGRAAAALGGTVPRYPGLMLNTKNMSEAGFKRTAFHEMLHLLGYPHGDPPEITASCEACCMGSPQLNYMRQPGAQPRPDQRRVWHTSADDAQADLCGLCGTSREDGMRPEHVGRLARSAYLLNGANAASPEALGAMVTRQYQAGNPTAFVDAATAIKNTCENGILDRCDPRRLEAYLLLISTQVAISEAGLPGNRDPMTVYWSLELAARTALRSGPEWDAMDELTRRDRDMFVRGAMVGGSVLAARLAGRSPAEGARRFVHDPLFQSACRDARTTPGGFADNTEFIAHIPYARGSLDYLDGTAAQPYSNENLCGPATPSPPSGEDPYGTRE